ncbi:hypothetical protein Q5762_39120, partial [Streptomyces sp. P9(2023)]
MTRTHTQDRTDRSAGNEAKGFKSALINAFIKLAPQHIIKNPVMALVWLSTVLTAVATLAGWTSPGFGWSVTFVLL